MQYFSLTGRIIGCAMTVHSTLGNGFQESIYQRCLEIEFAKAALKFRRETEIPISYDNRRVGKRRVDFLVEDKVVVELKAVISLDNNHLNQALNYQEAFNLEAGLLINFGSRSLQFKRLFNRKFRDSNTSEKS